MEKQFALPDKSLDLERPLVLRRDVAPLPGFFKRGGLRGVTYTSHIGRAYVS